MHRCKINKRIEINDFQQKNKYETDIISSHVQPKRRRWQIGSNYTAGESHSLCEGKECGNHCDTLQHSVSQCVTGICKR